MARGRLVVGLMAAAAALVLAVHVAHTGSHHISELLVMHSVSLPGGWNSVPSQPCLVQPCFGGSLYSPVHSKMSQLEDQITRQ
jgi:hypothetical protein